MPLAGVRGGLVTLFRLNGDRLGFPDDEAAGLDPRAAYGIVVSMKSDMWTSLGDGRPQPRAPTPATARRCGSSSSRSVRRPRPEVWHAVTTAERIARWLGTGVGRPGARRPLPDRGQCRRHGATLPGAGAAEVTWEFGGDVDLGGGHAHRGRRRHRGSASSTRRPPTRPSSSEFGPAPSGIGWEMALGGLPAAPRRPGGTAARPRLARDPGYSAFVHGSRAPPGPRPMPPRAPTPSRRTPPRSAASRPTPPFRPTRARADARLRRPRRPGPAPDPRARWPTASSRPGEVVEVIGGGVRDRAAGGVHAAQGAARERLRRRSAPTAGAASTRSTPLPLAQVDAWLSTVPPVLGAAARRARDRAAPRASSRSSGAMRVTRWSHSCLALESGRAGPSSSIPAGWSDAQGARRRPTPCCVTHEHSDHVDVDRVRAAGLPVWAPRGSDLGDLAFTPIDPGESAADRRRLRGRPRSATGTRRSCRARRSAPTSGTSSPLTARPSTTRATRSRSPDVPRDDAAGPDAGLVAEDRGGDRRSCAPSARTGRSASTTARSTTGRETASTTGWPPRAAPTTTGSHPAPRSATTATRYPG